MRYNVLDKGYLELVDKLGDDLTPVNAARVSFGGRSNDFEDRDRKLVKYLIKHKHHSPFRHQHIMLVIKAPEFVMRQWYKHVVGIETTSSSSTKDHAWNEISGRYVEVEEYYHPTAWRKQSKDNKQASDGELGEIEQLSMHNLYMDYLKNLEMTYERMINSGVAKEQARILLPLSQYTKVWWTASFQSVMNFIELRDESTAQWEIQQYAQALKQIMGEVFPETMRIWTEVHNWK